MLVETLKKLPLKEQKLWRYAYNAAKDKGITPSSAAKVALTVITQKHSLGPDSWIERGGAIINTNSVILRNFDSDGDTFVEAYVSSFDPDDGDVTKNNGGMSFMVSKEAAYKIAKEIESLGIGGGIEHDTFKGSKNYDPEADDVWSVVKADVDTEGIKVLFKLNKDSKRYKEVLEGIPRRKYRGASLEIIPLDNDKGIKLRNINGRYVNEITDFRRIEGVTLTRSPLDRKARIKATYTSKKK